MSWCGNNFCAALGDNVPGAVVLTAKTFEHLKRDVPKTLRFHVEGMRRDGEPVPEWLAKGDYEFEYRLHS